MAETLNESVGKDPLQDVFIAKSLSQKLTAESTVVNNEDFTIINKQYQNGKKSDVHSFDNGIKKQSEGDDDPSEHQVLILNQDCVKWNNSENTGLSLSHFCDPLLYNNIISDETTNASAVSVVNNGDVIKGRLSENETVNDKSAPLQNSTDVSIKHDEQSSKKGKKGIRFPKDTYISGYFEPPDPWKNAPPWTTEELINAYKKSCELHGTKPLGKITQQLQTISTSEKREELFTLKGEKLDQKQCECIEEIFRRVQFKLLDLEACHLDDECATALFDMIEYYETSCQLNISFNKNIQARGWQACSRLVRRTPNLTYLDIRNCDLNERFIPIFGRALKLGCHLTILHMEGLALSGRPLVILVAALKMNETLQELFLADNKLMPTDGVQLGNLLRYNHKLSLLDLRNNHLQDVGTGHICDGLTEQNLGKGLHTLVLWNNQINYQAMSALGRALAGCDCLETLNIGHNAITNEGVHLIKEGLLKTNSLLRLGLQGTKISDEGAVALAEYIADSNILLRIDLRENDIKTGGLMALSHAMRVNTSVTRIDLDKDPKKESGIKDYADQQSRLLRDILTFQQRNIQSTIEREEQERRKRDERTEEAEVESKDSIVENIQEIVDNVINESFTLIEEEESSVQDTVQEKQKKDLENLKLKDEGSEPEPPIEQTENTIPKVCAVVEKVYHRPSQLFPYKHLHPQETLDSPIPSSDENPLIAVMTTTAVVSQTSPQLYRAEKNLLSSIVSASPPEMILSPQYFPKQIVRKIFSVSRVDEDPSWSKLSTSPTPSTTAGFDPLNISPVPLVSTSSSLSSPSSQLIASASPVIIPQISQGVPQHSTNTDQQQLSSPCSPQLLSLSEQLMAALHAQSAADKSLGFQPTCDTKQTEDDDTSAFIFSDTNNCDKQQVNSAAAIIDIVPDKEELDVDRVVNKVNDSHKVDQDFENFNTELLQGPNSSSDIVSNHEQKHFPNDLLEEALEKEIVSSDVASPVTFISDSQPVYSLESSLEDAKNTTDDPLATTSNNQQQAAYVHCGAGDVVPIKECPESPQTTGSSSKPLPEMSQLSNAPETLTSLSADMSADLNSSNSNKSNMPGLDVLQPGVTLESKLLGLGSNPVPGTEQLDEEGLLVESFPALLSLDKSDEEIDRNLVCDNLDNDIETVEINSIDEEPWLAVDEGDLDKSTNSAKQPDFFTTLSSNGFTQELASALTNLDGSNGYYEDDNDYDLQTPGEFERELDSMLAVVHGDLPWTLKDS